MAFRSKPRGGPRYRFSLDLELGRHVASKTEAEQIATDIRSAINAGTFRQNVTAMAAPATVVAPVMTLDIFAPIYIERAAKASGKASWKDDVSLLVILRNHRGADGRRLGDCALSAITEDELKVFHGALRRPGRAREHMQPLRPTHQETVWPGRPGKGIWRDPPSRTSPPSSVARWRSEAGG